MENRKLAYEEPDVEIIRFEAEDVVTVSDPFSLDETPD